MKTIEFECETITSMFLAGADGKTPELRPPSIKGLMRFWWRAMNGHRSIDELRKREAEIFGGSGTDNGRSKVTIRIRCSNTLKTGKNIKDDYQLRWRYNGQQKTLAGDDAGIGYLLYSTVLGNGREYIKNGQIFKVELRSNDTDMLRMAASSFWALTYLGGIGTRARRGGGNIAVTQIIDKDNILKSTNLDFALEGKDSNEIAEWLIKNYNIAKSIVNNKGKDTKFISEYSNLSISRFITSEEGFNDWKEALNDIGKTFASFRTKNKWDVFNTASFGLPRKHLSTNRKDVNRRSSPLIFKVLRSNNKCYWMALRLAGEFLPADIVLKDNSKTQKSDYSKIDEFWNIIGKDNIAKILSIPDTLKNLKDSIVKELSPSGIVLFGSKARGDYCSDSDIDIAIVTDKSIGLSSISGSIDLIDLKNIDDEFRKVIEKEGIAI